MTNIYVLNADGTPLMPCHSFGRAKRMVRSGKARIVNTVPFTLRLTKQVEAPVVQECILGIDPGRTNIGLCAVSPDGQVLYASTVVTRNKTIASLMLERKRARQASRRGERKRRQRRAIAADAAGMAKATEFWRMLPGCEKAVRCKVFRNTEAKFANRKRKAGWLTPTARHLLLTHLNAVRLVGKILPVSAAAIEVNSFDFARMKNPGIRNWEYQKGKLSGFRDVREAVSVQQDGRCLLCGKQGIDHYHHIVPRGNGSENMDNIAGLCARCHEKVHNDTASDAKLKAKKQGLLKKYHALSVLNQIMERLLNELAGICPVYVTTGLETKALRKMCRIEKTHALDALCIALSALSNLPDDRPDFSGTYDIRQFRRHDRARVGSQTERTYRLDGQVVAKNRRRRMDQKEPSLHDFYIEMKRLHGKKEARRIQSRLTVAKSTRRYNDTERLMPGTVFIHDGKRCVMSGQITNGRYLRAIGDGRTNYKRSECRIIQKNRGLVYL